MFGENELLNKILGFGRKVIPKRVFRFLQPVYHWSLSMLGTVVYGFPARSLTIIGVTGTKGKSTTVYMIAKILEAQGLAVAAIGSLGFKIREKEWPNNLKMTMPGRLKLQKFLARARDANCEYVILEVTSEGLAQHRLAGIKVDCAVFTNLHREHLESHGSFENYIKAKQRLFLETKHIHVLNIDDPHFEKFANFPAKIKITCGRHGLINSFRPPISDLRLQLLGDFNEHNAYAALAVAEAYRLDLKKAVATLNSIESIPGRMEVIESPKGFKIIVDYAHTPDSLEMVYQNLKNLLLATRPEKLRNGAGYSLPTKLICVLGAAGGGRDKWKRPEFGKIASRYCDEIILTNEDPYDENPEQIIDQIAAGFSHTTHYSPRKASQRGRLLTTNFLRILDRGEAVKSALTQAQSGDIVVITGKGSETSIAVAGGKKIPWSDREAVMKSLSKYDQ